MRYSLALCLILCDCGVMAKDRLREIADRYWDEVTFFPWVVAVAFIVAAMIQRAL